MVEIDDRNDLDNAAKGIRSITGSWWVWALVFFLATLGIASGVYLRASKPESDQAKNTPAKKERLEPDQATN